MRGFGSALHATVRSRGLRLRRENFMAGDSGTPLPSKLGIEAGSRVVLVDAPPGFRKALGELPGDARLLRQRRAPVDVTLYFTKRSRGLKTRLRDLSKTMAQDGGLWVAWPKKSSGVATDLDFDTVQKTGLDLGLVDNKICAVDETWSGLRFVIRKENRKKT